MPCTESTLSAPDSSTSIHARACSLALHSLTETKDTLLLVCVAVLNALDRLQERLHLPTSLVKDVRRRLMKLIDKSRFSPPSSSESYDPLTEDKRIYLASHLSESDMWENADGEEVKGVIQWLISVTKSVTRLVTGGTRRVYRGICVLIMMLPGVSTACTIVQGIFSLVEKVISWGSRAAMEVDAKTSSHRGRDRSVNYMADPSLTAVVLEYREKECMVPLNINRRIQRVMHFQIPLRSFEATVRIPPESMDATTRSPESHRRGLTLTSSGSSGAISSTSPRSIPASPVARKRVQLAFSNFSDDVLYQARDRLRQERTAMVTGSAEVQIPRFSVCDCHDEIFLSCGRHCATKMGSGMYRSVRASASIPSGRFVYFEMVLNEIRSPLRPNIDTMRGASGASSRPNNIPIDASVCVGLSTRTMPLNALTGTSKYSVGLYSAGHILVGSEKRNFINVKARFGYESTVGILVRIDRRSSEATATASVRFCVDGRVLVDSSDQVVEVLLDYPIDNELFPTLTLHSQDLQVYGMFSASDVPSVPPGTFNVESEGGIWALDGMRVDRTAARPAEPATKDDSPAPVPPRLDD